MGNRAPPPLECVMCMSGCPAADHEEHYYMVADHAAAFFHIHYNQMMSIADMERMVLDYADMNRCRKGTNLVYNKNLWELLQPMKEDPIPLYELHIYLQNLFKM